MRLQLASDDTKDGSPLRLGEVAYRSILEALFDRRIASGSYLKQNELTQLLGLPLQPLRDALRVLETEGVLKIHPRAGIEFMKADLELARSTYQFRSFIERPGARALAESGDKALVLGLIAEHRALSEQITSDGITEGVAAKMADLESRFHGAIVGSLHNPLIETAARRIATYTALIRMDRRQTPPTMQRTIVEHLDVLEACANHDADAAEHALSNHFQAALQRIMGMM